MSDGEPVMQPNFENELYGDFHATYEVRRFGALTKGTHGRPGQLTLGLGVGYWLLVGENDPDTITDPDELNRVRCVVRRPERKAIATRWLLPDKHGPLYYYQKLMLNIPWRDPTPSVCASCNCCFLFLTRQTSNHTTSSYHVFSYAGLHHI